MQYHVFHYISCYIAEIWITFGQCVQCTLYSVLVHAHVILAKFILIFYTHYFYVNFVIRYIIIFGMQVLLIYYKILPHI